MKCPYCAEEIKDEAILCRYCRAEKRNGVWQPPRERKIPTVPEKHPSQFTFRTTGIFFFVSAFFELLFMSSGVTLFGLQLNGPAALSYHLVYGGIFIGMGLALWRGPEWGLRMMFVGTIVYTIDKLQSLFFDKEIINQLDQYGALLGPEGEKIVRLTQLIITITILLCWWGFLFYVYRKKDYF